jgi:hypothetical protein
MFIEYSLEFEISDSIFDSRACLQEHSFVYSIEVQASDEWHLSLVVRFSFYDRSYDGHLDRGHSDRVSFVHSYFIPEGVIFAQHALEELVWCDIPIDLVGIGYEEAFASLSIKSILREAFIAIE